ncbi:MAG: hypothetical protein H6739_14170 [Alphaproteobacteria bacterium]|nr:hypothetical protein [Alphaproteobacteria bacterium]
MWLTLLLGGALAWADEPEMTPLDAYRAGMEDGRAAARGKPAASAAGVSAGVGFVVAGGTTLLVGPCLGGPLIAAAAGGPAVIYGGVPAEPDPGDWSEQSLDYQRGYRNGYRSALQGRRTRWAAAGGVAGAAVGVGLGVTATAVLLDRWGYTWGNDTPIAE